MTGTPAIIRNVEALRRHTADWRKAGLAYAVVPTMGAIHEGHQELVRQGHQHASRVIATVFVNPKQFAAHEDLAKYPRDEPGDVAKLGAAGADVVFMPAPEEVYPQGFSTTVSLTGPAKAGLEDRFRPHFFAGVATVVAKLFLQTGADVAMFGEKDYQQLMVVTRMARDLDIPIRVIGVPTVREADGLAKSSRNVYLSAAERRQALAIYASLSRAADAIRAGQTPQGAARAAARSLTASGFKVDYVAARNAGTLAPPRGKDEPLRLLAAAWAGRTRLIDNISV
jgi:pantoate--beta-alanine ligase